ncbi:MAG: hypothetical protein EXR72_21125, partial [Myxococcales bacterium]|nr:hypothetical protein [Myxococcales bacterium]
MRAPPSLRCLLAPLALLAFGCGVPELTTLGRSCGGDPLSCGPTETCWPGGDGILSCHGAKEYVAAGSDCELL